MGLSISEEEISSFIDLLHSKLLDSSVSLDICEHRDKNYIFYYLYSITKDYVRNVLLELDVSNFLYALENDNPNYPSTLLYVFYKNVILNNAAGCEVTMKLYIKLRLLNDRVVVISFHESL